MDNQGYVYFIGSKIFGWYKIGKSKTPEVRVKDLGILLPFKVEIIGVWKVLNRHVAEKSLHELYDNSKINGEWFEFTSKEAWKVFNLMPEEARVYPSENYSSFDKFSNISEDVKYTIKGKRKVIGLRVQKNRGDFSEEERESRKQTAIDHQRIRKILKAVNSHSEGYRFQLACNKPYEDKKVKINIFTSIVEH